MLMVQQVGLCNQSAHTAKERLRAIGALEEAVSKSGLMAMVTGAHVVGVTVRDDAEIVTVVDQ
jgi:hypothetical protein